MKPEEIDRLFRDKLEKLNHVPDMDWNDDAVWDKLTSHLKGGWNSMWTWTISTIAIITGSCLLYIIFKQDTVSVPLKENHVKKTPIVPMDSMSKVTKQKVILIKKNKDKTKSQRIITKAIDTVLLSSTDTTTSVSYLQHKTDEASAKPEIVFKKNTLIKKPYIKPEFTFQMPAMSLFRLKVNNSFNVSNLVKSIQAEKKADHNFYYFFEYDKSFVPPAYGNTHQRFTIDNTQIITNFNK